MKHSSESDAPSPPSPPSPGGAAGGRTLCLTSAISGVAWAQRTHPLVLGGARQWTQLTVGAPAAASVAAALGLGHQVPVAGGHLTQSGQDLGEAEAFAVIWRRREEERDR